MAEPTASGGAALFLKYFGLSLLVALAGAAGAALGFAVLWPRTREEGVARFFTAVAFSFILGPMLCVVVYYLAPGMFEAAEVLAVKARLPPIAGLFMMAAPLFIVAALPAWWVLGWFVRFADRRRNSDIGEVVGDIKFILKDRGES